MDRKELQKIVVECEPPLTLGSCLLREARFAQIVQDAIMFFESQRYRLGAWCVMPNHVHVVVQPLPPWQLSQILHTWKSFSAHRINRMSGRVGALWERESFDHMIRSVNHAEFFIQYIEENPVIAGICEVAADWPFSSRGAGFIPAFSEFLAPNELGYVPKQTRGELPHLYKPGCTYFVTWRLLDAVATHSVISE